MGDTDDAAVLGTRAAIQFPERRLYSEGIVVGADGAPLIVPPGTVVERLAGTPYLAPGESLPGAADGASAAAAACAAELGAAQLPGRDSPYASMARTALADIVGLCFPNGAAVAAASPYWRYVWPRDVGYMAVALARCGLVDRALSTILFVADCQHDDGTFEARYLPDGSRRPPDERGRQLDGVGWMLWAAWALHGATGDVHAAVHPLIRRSVDAALTAIGDDGMPYASQDFWEIDIAEPTLGSAAPLLLGLRCGRDLLAAIGDRGRAATAGTAATRLATAIAERFGAVGYARRVSGVGGRDASTAFLLPPFSAPLPGAEAAWRATVADTTLANGGVRPGEEWEDRETGWTPQVSLHALAAAGLGDTALAHRLLSWLAARCTAMGSLPEKVTADGRPAAVAPLGISGATVLLALAALDGAPIPTPAR